MIQAIVTVPPWWGREAGMKTLCCVALESTCKAALDDVKYVGDQSVWRSLWLLGPRRWQRAHSFPCILISIELWLAWTTTILFQRRWFCPYPPGRSISVCLLAPRSLFFYCPCMHVYFLCRSHDLKIWICAGAGAGENFRGAFLEEFYWSNPNSVKMALFR